MILSGGWMKGTLMDLHRLKPARSAMGVVAVAVVLMTLTSGCASDEVGMALPVVSMAEPVEADRVPYEGTMEADSQGCLKIRLTGADGVATDRWAVWPDGAEEVPRRADLGNGVRYDGELYLPGDPVEGTARLIALEAIRGGESGGGYWRGSGVYCGALVGGVILLDELRRA